MKMNDQMIYVHIPFCASKCYYCNFVSFANHQNKKIYFEKLCNEIKQRRNYKLVSSIYFGGGTPSSVEPEYIEKTINTIKQNYNLSNQAEITIECNPQSTTKEKLEKYFSLGFNRVSFGVQSFDEQLLKKLGRFQNKEQSLNAIKLAKQVGFKSISADLLLGFENQTNIKLRNTLKTLLFVGVNHISAYMLILEEDTPLFKKVQKGEINLPSEDETVELYNFLYEFLKQNGFERYEVSNFAKPGFESKHNLGYWQLKEYLGFGLSAHSYDGKTRSANSCNFEDYLNDQNKTQEVLNEQQKREDEIMLGLRTKYGIRKELVENNKNFENLLKEKFIKLENDRVVVNENCFGVLNQIILKLI